MNNFKKIPNKANKGGRPAGSGQQLKPAARLQKSRQARAAAGAARLDITLNNLTATALEQLVSHWGCKTRKEAIERAITTAAAMISR